MPTINIVNHKILYELSQTSMSDQNSGLTFFFDTWMSGFISSYSGEEDAVRKDSDSAGVCITGKLFCKNS